MVVGRRPEGLGSDAEEFGGGVKDGLRSSGVALPGDVVATNGAAGAGVDVVAFGVVDLLLLLDFKAANELVVNALSCADEIE